MIDRKKWIGHQLKTSVLTVDRTRLQFFAKVIGEKNPLYFDPAVAKDAGYRDVPAPPTFLFAAELDSGTVEQMVADMEIPMSKLLHGEQSFHYHQPVCAGDTVTVQSTVSDIYDKKGGKLEFAVKDSRLTNQHGALVAELRTVLVVRH